MSGLSSESFASRLYLSPICLIVLPVQPGEVFPSHEKPFPNTAFIKRREEKSFSSFLTPLRVSHPICVIAFVVHFYGPSLGTKVNEIIRFAPSSAVFRHNMMSTSNKFTEQQPTIRFTSAEKPSWPKKPNKIYHLMNLYPSKADEPRARDDTIIGWNSIML